MTLQTHCFIKSSNVMYTSTKHALAALAFVSILGSCSRPVATFQPSKAERFYTQQTVATPAPAAAEVAVPEATPAVAEAAPAPATKADIENVLVKAEAMASTKATAAESRKLERRITKIRQVLATTSESNLAPAASAKKMSLAQRLMTKSMDKKIQKHLAPESPNKPMAAGTLTAGLVIGLIGLLLLLLTSGTAATIGLIALVVGIVLVILGLL